MHKDTAATGDDPLAVPFRGLFSEHRSSTVGSGTTRKRSTTVLFWYTERLTEKATTIQTLNRNFVPSGPRQQVSREHVLEAFTPEPLLFQRKVLPQIERLEKALERGDALRGQEQFKRAETQYGTALALDENNVRACFGIGIVHARQGNRDKASAVLGKLLSMEEVLGAGCCTTLFNEFGIALRKRGMLDEALRFYTRCLGSSCGCDDHLLFNIARVHMEREDNRAAMECLDEALAINPKLTPALLMRRHLAAKTVPA